MCSVGVVCIGATWGCVCGMGVCVWGAPVGAGRGQRQRPRDKPGKGQHSVCGGVAGV